MNRDLEFLLTSLKAYQNDPNNEIWTDEDRETIYKKLAQSLPELNDYFDLQGNISKKLEPYFIETAIITLETKVRPQYIQNTNSLRSGLEELVLRFQEKQKQDKIARLNKIIPQTLNRTRGRIAGLNNNQQDTVDLTIYDATKKAIQDSDFSTTREQFKEKVQVNLKQKFEENKDKIGYNFQDQFFNGIAETEATLYTPTWRRPADRIANTVSQNLSTTITNYNTQNQTTSTEQLTWDTIVQKVAEKASTLQTDIDPREIVTSLRDTIANEIKQIQDPEVRQRYITTAGSLTQGAQQFITDLTSAASSAYTQERQTVFREELQKNAAKEVIRGLERGMQYDQSTPQYQAEKDNVLKNLDQNRQYVARIAEIVDQASAEIIENTSFNTSTAVFNNTLEQKIEPQLNKQVAEIIVGAATAAFQNTQQQFNQNDLHSQQAVEANFNSQRVTTPASFKQVGQAEPQLSDDQIKDSAYTIFYNIRSSTKDRYKYERTEFKFEKDEINEIVQKTKDILESDASNLFEPKSQKETATAIAEQVLPIVQESARRQGMSEQGLVGDISKVTEKATDQHYDALLKAKNRLFESASVEMGRGDWQDTHSIETIGVYKTQRETLLQQYESDKTYNPKRATETRQKIDQLDNRFFREEGKTAVNSYYEHFSVENAEKRAAQAPQANVKLWNNLVEVVYGTQASANDKENIAILQKAPILIEEIQEKIATGAITREEAKKQLIQAAVEQKEIFKVTQRQQFYQPPEEAENSRLQKTIDEGASQIEKQFKQQLALKIGQDLYVKKRISPADEERELVTNMGWEEYDRFREELKKQNITSRDEIKKAIHEKLVSELGEDGLNYSIVLQREYNQPIEKLTPDFYTELAKQILDLYAKNPSAPEGEVIRIFNDELRRFTSEKNIALYRLPDDVIVNIVQKLKANPKLQEAFTAAHNMDLVIPFIDDDTKSGKLQDRLFLRTLVEQTPGFKPMLPRQVEQEFTRELYRSSFIDILKEYSVSEASAGDAAQQAVYASIGGLTQPLRPNEDWQEHYGALASEVKKFSKLQTMSLELMSPEDREKYFKTHPSETEQRLRALIDAAIKDLQRNGINIDQVKDGKTLRQRIEATFRELNTEDVLKMKIEGEKSPAALSAAVMAKSSGSLSIYFRNNIVERRLGNAIFGVPGIAMNLLPITFDTEGKRAFILAAIMKSGTASKQLDSNLNYFISTNRLTDKHKQAILSGNLNQEGLEWTWHQKATASQLANKQRILNVVAAFRASHPKIAAWLDKNYLFNQRDDVTIIKGILLGGDPFHTSLKYAKNYAINNVKLNLKWNGEKIYWINPMTKHVEIKWWYDTKEKLKDQIRFRVQKFTRPITNWIRNTITKPLGAAIKRALIKRLGEQVVGKLLVAMTGVGALPVIIITIAQVILNLPIIKQLKQLLQLGTLLLAVNILRFVGWLFGPVLSLLGGGFAAGSLGVAGTAVGPAVGTFSIFGSAGMSGAIGSMTGNLFVSTSNFISNAGKLFSNIFNSVAKVPSFLSGTFASVGNLGVGGISTLAAVGTVSIMAPTMMTTIMTALKDGPDINDTGSPEVTQANPLKLTKTATVNAVGPNYKNGDRISYKLNVESPPCNKIITVTDTVPANVDYLPNSASYTQPLNPGIERIDVTVTPDNKLINWLITIKNDSVKEPCTSALGVLGAGTALRDVTYMTKDEIIGLITSKGVLKDNADHYADLILSQAQSKQVNPALILGIFNHENGMGAGLGPGRAAPPGDRQRTNKDEGLGCRNLGNQRPGDIPLRNNAYDDKEKCLFGKDNKDHFAYYKNYDDSITATFDVIDSYIQGGITTIDGLANRYSPASDGPNGARFNLSWKQDVSYTLKFKKFGNDGNIYEVGDVNNDDGKTQSGGNITAELTFEALINSPLPEDCIENTAKALVGTAENTLTRSARATTSVGGKKCSAGSEEFCSVDPATLSDTDIITRLRNGKIYPTESSKYPPKNAFTRNQVNLIWKLACRVTQSHTFYEAASGDDGFEIQKVACNVGPSKFPECPLAPKHRAYYKGVVPYSEVPGTRLLLITDKMDEISDDQLFIHLVAHEMGHSAQAAGGQIGSNKAMDNYNALFECTKVVSHYADGYDECPDRAIENHAEMIGLYLTNGENHEQYYGKQKDFSKDTEFVSTPDNGGKSFTIENLKYYNTLKQDFFDGVEFDNNDL